MREFMNGIKNLVIRLLSPHIFRFTNTLKEAFIEAVKETHRFDESIRDLSQTWLAICPHTYFSELFLEKESWNIPFVRALRNSDMIKAKECYKLTQGFYLCNLFRLLAEDEKYRKYSIEKISQNILSNMNFGNEILEFAFDFKKDLENMTSIEYFSMFYVEKILQQQYPIKNVLDPVLNSIWTNSGSLFGLTVFTTESLKKAKYLDSQSSITL
jgi:hypothetical protein